MKKLFSYLKDYKKESILAPLFKLLEASFELFVPLVVASIVDQGILKGDISYIWKMCALLIALALIGFICAVTAQFFAAKAAVGFATKLRSSLFSHMQGLSFTEIDKVGTSTLITRMTSDINQLQSGVNMVLRLFMRSPIVVFGAMIMAFTVNVKAAWIFVIAIPLLAVVVFGVMLITIPMYKKVQASLDKVLGRTRENLTGARVIRAFAKEEQEKAAFEEENQKLTDFQLLVGRISALMNPVTYIIVNCATIAIVWVGGTEVFAGVITQGEVIALVNYMSQILVELVKLANLIILITKAVACGNRVADVLELESSMKSGSLILKDECDAEYMVEFENAGICYDGAAETALSGINLKVAKGQIIGVIGGTGSGKSTLVHLIARFYDATEGVVRIKGHDVKEYDLTALRDMIGIVMQKAVLFKGTIADNLRWGKADATEEEMWNALEVAQAVDVVKGKAEGLEHEVLQGGKNLSGGQRQRLTIARSVIKDPEILIFDDSASALDFATDAKLRAALSNMSGDKTIFIVSQRTSSIQFADQIVVLDDGEMVGLGSHEELLKNCDVYKEIYDSQFKKEEGGR